MTTVIAARQLAITGPGLTVPRVAVLGAAALTAVSISKFMPYRFSTPPSVMHSWHSKGSIMSSTIEVFFDESWLSLHNLHSYAEYTIGIAVALIVYRVGLPYVPRAHLWCTKNGYSNIKKIARTVSLYLLVIWPSFVIISQLYFQLLQLDVYLLWDLGPGLLSPGFTTSLAGISEEWESLLETKQRGYATLLEHYQKLCRREEDPAISPHDFFCVIAGKTEAVMSLASFSSVVDWLRLLYLTVAQLSPALHLFGSWEVPGVPSGLDGLLSVWAVCYAPHDTYPTLAQGHMASAYLDYVFTEVSRHLLFSKA